MKTNLNRIHLTSPANWSVMLLAVSGLFLTSCQTYTQRGALYGGLGGAAIGGIAKGGKGALVGGALGAAGGAVLGNMKDKRYGIR